MRAQWPSYFAYAVSFMVIGIMWMNHKTLFRDVDRPDHTSAVLNLGLLMCVAFIPFPTALLAQYVRDGYHQTGAITVYGLTLTITAFVYNALWLYIAYVGRLLHEDVSPRRVRSRTLRYLPGAPIYALTIPAAYINIDLALAMYAGLAVLYLLPTPE